MNKRLKPNNRLFIKTHYKTKFPIIFKKIPDRSSAEGLCYSPYGEKPRITIDRRLKKRRKLNVLIEEVSHAFFWDLPEYKVRKFSAELGKVIYKLFIKKHKRQ